MCTKIPHLANRNYSKGKVSIFTQYFKIESPLKEINQNVSTLLTPRYLPIVCIRFMQFLWRYSFRCAFRSIQIKQSIRRKYHKINANHKDFTKFDQRTMLNFKETLIESFIEVWLQIKERKFNSVRHMC